MKEKKQIVDEWFKKIDDAEKFLDFAEGLHINEFAIENGERVIWLEDGMHYIAHGERIGEKDDEKEKEIIEALEACGIEFKEQE